MNQITYKRIKEIAKPGDIIIGTFIITDHVTFRVNSKILLIEECVGCVVDKADVEAGTTKYLQLQDDGYTYKMYQIIKEGL